MAVKRELFKSLDVCEMAQLQPYMLRSWEAEFPGLGQPAGAGGGRVYRRADVEMVLRIKQLVFGEGLTLAGARRRLEEEQDGPSGAAVAVADALGDMARMRLKQVRSGLEAIMQLLSRDAAMALVPELQLLPPPAGAGQARGRARQVVAAARRPAKSAAKAAGGKRGRHS
jgi:DNA-binding transcriptional MerR regulator